MMIHTIALWFCVASCVGFALFHAALVLGAPLGEFALGGKYRVLPRRMRPVSAIFVAYFIALFLAYISLEGYAITDPLSLSRMPILPRMPALPSLVLVIVNTLFLGYAIWGNLAVTKSRKERLVMAPLSIACFAASLVVIVPRFISR